MSSIDDDDFGGDLTSFDGSDSYLSSRQKRDQPSKQQRVSALTATIDSDDDYVDDDFDDTHASSTYTSTSALVSSSSQSTTIPIDRTRGVLLLIRRSKELRPASKFERPTRKTTFTIRYSLPANISADDIPSHNLEETFVQHGERPMVALDTLAKEGDYVMLDRSVGEATGSGAIGSVIWKVDKTTMIAMKDELEAQAAMLKRSRPKRIRIDAARLLDPEIGIKAIVKDRFSKIRKFKLKENTEVEDLHTLIGAYREWALLLHPNMNFRRVVTSIDKLSSDRDIVNALMEMRDQQYERLHDRAMKEVEAQYAEKHKTQKAEQERILHDEKERQKQKVLAKQRALQEKAHGSDTQIVQPHQQYQQRQQRQQHSMLYSRKHPSQTQNESLGTLQEPLSFSQDDEAVASGLAIDTYDSFSTSAKRKASSMDTYGLLDTSQPLDMTALNSLQSRMFEMNPQALEETRKRLDENMGKLTEEDEVAQRLFDSLVTHSDDEDEQ